MKKSRTAFQDRANRRSFLKKGMVEAGTTTARGLLLNGSAFAFDGGGPPITKGDIAHQNNTRSELQELDDPPVAENELEQVEMGAIV
jgi:hypothetical protein